MYPSVAPALTSGLPPKLIEFLKAPVTVTEPGAVDREIDPAAVERLAPHMRSRSGQALGETYRRGTRRVGVENTASKVDRVREVSGHEDVAAGAARHIGTFVNVGPPYCCAHNCVPAASYLRTMRFHAAVPVRRTFPTGRPPAAPPSTTVDVPNRLLH